MASQMSVVVEPGVKVTEKVEDMAGEKVMEATKQWEELLKTAEAEGMENLELASFVLSETPSTNFQVLGQLFRTLNMFLRQHENPKHVRILCDTKETATFYRQVYNFYIPATKADRMEDEGWD